jgi:hypothetical protein
MKDDHEPGGKRFRVIIKMQLRQLTTLDAWNLADDMIRGKEMMTDNVFIDSVEEIPE